MQLKGDRMPFGGAGGGFRPVRILVLVALIAGGILLTRLVEAGRVEPLFLPTPTLTRTALSHREEGEAHFAAGDLERSIEAFEEAVFLQPDDPELLAELARVQTYSSALIATADGERDRLEAAKASIDQAIEVDPDNSYAWAIRTLVYDWLASLEDDLSTKGEYFRIAQSSADQALNLDPNNSLALAFWAEVFVDQLEYARALDMIEKALAQDPNRMDVLRVYGTVLESHGRYDEAIDAYGRAAERAPNLTFLYLRMGANHRREGRFDEARAYFIRAANINQQLGILDPIPYIAIGRTWLQEGATITAARSAESAVSIDPTNPDLLGFLGIAYFKARNYENAEMALRCAIDGCEVGAQTDVLCTGLVVLNCDQDRLFELQAQSEGQELDSVTLNRSFAELVCESSSIPDCTDDQVGRLMAGVPGLELDGESLEYFYTYGSVLAFEKKCSDAENIFTQLVASFGTDPIVSAIVSEGRALCGGEPDQMPEDNS
jgi:tetratricopeptide (TPR) repeat protein